MKKQLQEVNSHLRNLGSGIENSRRLGLNQLQIGVFMLLAMLTLAGLQNANAQVAYTQNFETGIASWSTNWSISSLTTPPVCSGLQTPRKNIYTVGTQGDFVSPSLGTSNGGVVTMSFSYKLINYSSPYAATPATFGTINVQQASSASGPWSTIYTINALNHIPSTSCATVNVPGFSPANGPLFIRYNCIWGTGDYYLYFDDISISQGAAPACQAPSLLGAIPTSTGASLNWTENGTATAWDIEYGLMGFTPGLGTTVVASANPHSISGLSANTAYSYYVRANCGGSGTSTWSGPFTFTTLCASQLSGTITLDPSLPASSTNFVSFAALQSELAQCGISGPLTVNVKEGTYAGQTAFSGNYVGSSTVNTITIRSNPANTNPVILTHAPTLSGVLDNYTLQLNGVSNMVFSGLTLQSTGTTYTRIVLLSGSSSNIKFTNNIFDAPATTTASTSNATFYYNTGYVVNGLTVENNTFNNNAYAFYLVSSSTLMSDNFVLTNNTFNGLYYAVAYNGYWKNVNVSGNTANFASSTTTQYGLYFYNSSTVGSRGEQVIIEKNILSLNTTGTMYGAYLTYYLATSSNISRITNNFISNSATTGTGTRYGIYFFGGAFMNIYHNSINILDGSPTASRGIYLGSTTSVTASDVNIKNNIISINKGYAIEIASTYLPMVSAMNYNLFKYDVTNLTPYRYGTTNYATQALWTAATLLDANSLEGDPGFISSSDLHLIGTIANDVGDNSVGVTTDIDGQTRPLSPSTIVDIGADEYALASCTQSTGLMVNTLTATTANVSWVSTSGATAWSIEYGPTGYTQGAGTTVAAGTNPFTITGLTAQTTYDFYVRDNCGGLNGNSAWTGPVSFTTFCANQLSGTVTINPLLPASATNFQSFAALEAELALCGIGGPTTVNVKEGTYTGKVNFGSYINSSATNVLTIQADPLNTSAVIVKDSALSTSTLDNYVVQLSGSGNIHFDGITIQAKGTVGSRIIQMTGNCSNIAFNDVIFDAPVSTTASTTYSTFYYLSPLTFDGLSITNSTFNNNSYGLYLLGSSSILSDNFVFEDNTLNNFYAYGLYMTYVKNASIKNNVMTSSSSTSTQYGVYLSGGSTNLNERAVIEGNEIMLNTTSTFYGVYMSYYSALMTNPSSVTNNMISNAATTGTGTRYGIYPYACNYLNIYHNSVSILDGSATAARALYLNSTTSVTSGNLNIKNNIFSVGATGYAVEIGSAAVGYVSTMNNNLYNFDVLNTTAYRNNNVNYSSLAAWTLATLFDANGVEGDPQFFGASDLHVFGALANDAGDNTVGVLTDIDGQSRPASGSTTVDIGADEYTPAACTPPVNVVTTNVLATSADIMWHSTNGTPTGSQIEWGASGFTQGAGTLVIKTGADSTHTLTSLTPQTTYDFYLRDKCTLYSAWVGPFTFTTACAAFTAPFTENFDSLALVSPYTALPACWDVQVGPDYWDVTNDITNNGHSYLPNIGDHTSGTTNYMWIDASGDITANEMVTPLINMSSLTVPYAGFWFASNNTNNTVNHTIALDAWDGTAWVNITTERGNFTGWVEVGGPVPSTIPTTTKFRIYAIPDTGTTSGTYFYNDLGVDDFFVMEAPSCVAPTMLGAYNSTTTSVDVYWTGGGATDYNIEYGPVGFTPGAGTYMSSTNDTATISGLTAATSYQAYVRDSCGAGNSSVWVGPVTFSTQVCAASSQCWFTVNMTDSYGDGWNGALVSFKINGIEVDVVGSTFTNGFTAVDSVSLCDMDSVEIVVKNQGSYSTEPGFTVLDPQGSTLYTWTNGSGFTTGVTLSTIYAQCAAPSCPVTDVPMVAAQASCGPNPVVFTATGNTKPNTQGYFWMRSSDSAVVAMGNPFTTPPITAAETWYAAIGTLDDAVAKHRVVDSVAGTTGGYGNFTNGMFFTALDNMYLDSVTVRANGPLSFIVRVYEPIPGPTGGAGALIMISDTIVIPAAGDYQVPVGLAFTTGDYFMNMSVITGSGGGALWRTTSGAVYPYTVPGLVSVTGANFSGARIYYFFDWVVSEVCVSTLAAANATFAPVPSTALPYAEAFNTGLPCNWSTDAAATGADWMNVANYGGTSSIDGTNFMFVDDDAPGSSAITHASLVSPAFNAAGYDTLFIEFDHYFRALGSSAGYVEVYDGTAWQTVYTATGTSVGSWTTPDHQAIDITMYQNADLQVRFRYNDGGAYAWYWGVDNFELDGILTPCQNVVVNIVTDIFGSETSWSIVDTATGVAYATGGPYADVSPYNVALATHIDTICLPIGQFFEFRLEDSYGDGLVDGTNTGTYTVDILCTWGNNNVINGSGLFPYGSTTNPPNYDSTVFEVTCLVPCSDPDSLSAMVACTTADLSWVSESGAMSTVQWGPAGFTPGTGTMISGATSPTTLSSLMPGTSYDFWVLDTCVSGTASMWVGPITFTTDSLPTINATATLVSSGTTVTYDFTASGTGLIYGWDFGDGGQDTGTAVTHIYTANGTYQVVVAAYNACGISFDTLTAVVQGIGIDEFGIGNIALYPNPNDGYFTISGLTNYGSDATIEVVNMTGAVIYRQKIVANSSETFVIDLRGYAPGVYQVRVSSEKGVGAKPFVLRN